MWGLSWSIDRPMAMLRPERVARVRWVRAVSIEAVVVVWVYAGLSVQAFLPPIGHLAVVFEAGILRIGLAHAFGEPQRLLESFSPSVVEPGLADR
jgi:hypothetical protein